jgi:hypothetical protein
MKAAQEAFFLIRDRYIQAAKTQDQGNIRNIASTDFHYAPGVVGADIICQIGCASKTHFIQAQALA